MSIITLIVIFLCIVSVTSLAVIPPINSSFLPRKLGNQSKSQSDGQYLLGVNSDRPSLGHLSSDAGKTWHLLNIAEPGDELQLKYGGLSGSGQYQILLGANAGTDANLIYLSSNFGNDWIQQHDHSCTQNWAGVDISSSGQYQTAITQSDVLCKSSTYGKQWISLQFGTRAVMKGVSMSSSGQYQTVVLKRTTDQPYPSEGNLYRSNNHGAMFYSNSNAIDDPDLLSVSLSSSGQYQLVGSETALYLSSDFGETWVKLRNAPSGGNGWGSIAVSSSAQYQFALRYGDKQNDNIYLSKDFGATWTETFPHNPPAMGQFWNQLALSSSGQSVLVGGFLRSGAPDPIYQSTDFGASWTGTASVVATHWTSVAMSRDPGGS